MENPYRHIIVERNGAVFGVRLNSMRMSEKDVLEMADELLGIVNRDGCRKMVLSLGPGQVDCLYSVFLAKLVTVRRHMAAIQGKLKIAEASPETIGVFEACQLKEFFEFVPDMTAALAHFED